MKKTTKLKAEEWEKKFDQGDDDILDHFDTENIVKRVNVDFPIWMVKELDKESNRLGIGSQALIKTWIASKLGDKKAG